MNSILTILLLSSEGYINRIKPKREWIINFPYSELKSLYKHNKQDLILMINNNNNNNEYIKMNG